MLEHLRSLDEVMSKHLASMDEGIHGLHDLIEPMRQDISDLAGRAKAREAITGES